MSRDSIPRLPSGFGGSYGREDLWSSGGRTLRLPEQAVLGGATASLPDGTWDTILVDGLSESFGNLERFCKALAERLAERGRVVLDVENACSARAVRHAIEGKLSALEPFGSVVDPERRVTRRRILQALASAGLLVEDVIDVPVGNDRVGPEFVRQAFAAGFLPTTWVGRPPAARLWLVASKGTARHGTVLVGPGDHEEQQRTIRAVSALLPPDSASEWEVVACDHAAGDARECTAFARGIAESKGRTLWLLRAGAEADEPALRALLARTPVSPAVPGAGGLPEAPGDVSGLALVREDALLAGPFDDRWQTDAVAYEEWLLRLDGIARSPAVVAASFWTPPVPASAPGDPVLEEEARLLLERWEPIGKPAPRPAAGAPRTAPWGDHEPCISLVMMVKDEQRFLPECLERAAQCVDEIVVVDTGSTDATVEIARSFGATVLHFDWCDDFSAARNYGLLHATGDWVLVLDADEFLVPGQERRIRELVRDPGIAGYHLVFQNVYTGGKTLGVIMVRLFRNLPGLRWRNRLHEQISPALVAAGHEQRLTLATSDVVVEHHGYSDEVMDARKKNERNERLFLMQLETMPEDVYTLYKYGDFLRRVPGRSADARSWLEKAHERVYAMPPLAATEIPYAAEIAALLAIEHAREGDDERALAIVERALRHLLPTPNLHYVAGTLALRVERPDEALLHFERCLTYRDQVLVVAIQEGITSWVALTGIAQAHLLKGDRRTARRLLASALELKPDYDQAALTLSRMQAEEGDLGKALVTLTDLLGRNPGSVPAMEQATLLLARLGEVHHARALGGHAVALLEASSESDEATRLEQFINSLG